VYSCGFGSTKLDSNTVAEFASLSRSFRPQNTDFSIDESSAEELWRHRSFNSAGQRKMEGPESRNLLRHRLE
jgi:hypothetical protein